MLSSISDAALRLLFVSLAVAPPKHSSIFQKCVGSSEKRSSTYCTLKLDKNFTSTRIFSADLKVI